MRYALIFGYKAQLSILLTKSMILENGSKWNLINDKGIVGFLRKRDPVQMRALTREQPAQQEGMQMQWEGTSMKEQWGGVFTCSARCGLECDVLILYHAVG